MQILVLAIEQIPSYLFDISGRAKILGSHSIASLYAYICIVVTGCTATVAIYFYEL